MKKQMKLTTDAIVAALAANDGDIEKAAKALGTNARRLRIVMTERGISI